MNNIYCLAPMPKIFFATLLSVTLLSACKPSPSPEDRQETSVIPEASTENTITIDQESAISLTNQLWQQGLTTLKVVEAESQLLQNSVNELLTTPNDITLAASHTQWENIFLHYQELLPFLFIEHSLLASPLAQWRATLGRWPLQPGYLDSYDVYIQSGIVNDITLPITTESLRKQNGLTDPEEVTLGLYAIEYLLWGDKAPASSKRFFKQNTVPLLFEQAGLKVDELPNNRRRELLQLQAVLFKDDLSSLQKQWDTRGLLYKIFSALTVDEKLLAFHNGSLNQLKEIEALLAYETYLSNNGENNNNEGAHRNTYPERFYNNRQRAIAKQLSSIESLYFTNARDDDTAPFLSLATLLLSPLEKQALTLRIEDIKKQLTE